MLPLREHSSEVVKVRATSPHLPPSCATRPRCACVGSGGAPPSRTRTPPPTLRLCRHQVRVRGGATMELCLQLAWLANPAPCDLTATVEWHSYGARRRAV